MREISWHSIVGAFVVSAIVALSYPYIVLKLGLGPNVSLLSAMLGAFFLYLTSRRTHGRNRLMNNVIQTAGTSASSTAFMCVVAAAFDYLGQNQSVNVHVTLTSWQIFSWLTLSGAIGVLFIPLYRRYFLDDPKMIFYDGVSAAETIQVLDTPGKETRDKLRVLGGTLALGGIGGFLDDGLGALPPTFFDKRFQIGIDWSTLSFGMGLLVGLRVGLSLLLGTVLILLFGPLILAQAGLPIVRSTMAPEYIAQCEGLIGAPLGPAQQTLIADHCGMLGAYLKGDEFGVILLWTMWPATALLVSGAATAVALRWRSIVDLFRTLRSRRGGQPREDISVRTTLVGTVLLALLLAYVQNQHFGMSYVETLLAVVLELPLMLIGVRVLGETNFGPVSVMANALQVVFGIFWPNQIAHNLIAAGMAGDGNSQAEGTMQDFKTGQILGSTPRVLTYTQLCAIPIGAAAVAIMYPLLVARYGIGAGGDLVAPTGLKLANMAVLLTKGIEALPPGALAASIVAAILGVVFTVVETRWNLSWLPSVTSVGFGLILPGLLTVPIAIGALAGYFWQRFAPGSYDKFRYTAAAGLVGGEALVSGLILPALAYAGVFTPGG